MCDTVCEGGGSLSKTRAGVRACLAQNMDEADAEGLFFYERGDLKAALESHTGFGFGFVLGLDNIIKRAMAMSLSPVVLVLWLWQAARRRVVLGLRAGH